MTMHNNPSILNKVYIIAGPTAVGKTSFAIALAKQLATEIISADSRQCYQELSIGVARPSTDELMEVPHHFIASHSVADELNAGFFEQYALAQTEQVFKNHSSVVMVGGTGLYIKAFCEGIDPMPIIPAEIRAGIIEQYEAKGLVWLQAELKHKDPVFWAVAEQQNPQRLMRALEVLTATGVSIMEYRSAKKKDRNFEAVKIGLEIPTELLVNNINLRVDQMMQKGLLEEVQSTIAFRNKMALQTVGYKELFSHIDGKISLDEAVQQIKVHTRQYAKRQMTWFKKDPAFKWVDLSKISVEMALKEIVL